MAPVKGQSYYCCLSKMFRKLKKVCAYCITTGFLEASHRWNGEGSGPCKLLPSQMKPATGKSGKTPSNLFQLFVVADIGAGSGRRFVDVSPIVGCHDIYRVRCWPNDTRLLYEWSGLLVQ